MRRFAGWIGVMLPLVVLVFDLCISNYHCVPSSISASYYTGARNYFIGSLCAVGVFLVCSIGYKPDRPFSIFAGFMAFFVAFCPTDVDCGCYLPSSQPPFTHSYVVHRIAAVLLFLTFAVFCIFLFTRSTQHPHSFWPRFSGLPHQKKKRNVFFVLCGCAILVAMIAYPSLRHFFPVPKLSHLMYVIEWICLWAFGWAWLVKGQLIFADSNHPAPYPQLNPRAKAAQPAASTDLPY